MLDFEYRVVRSSRRKTISIAVSRDARVIVSVPKHLSACRVLEVLEKKAKWIRARIQDRQNLVRSKPKTFASGESYAYLGKDYRLKVEESGISGIKGENLIIRVPPDLPPEDRQGAVVRELKEWYISEALKKAMDRTSHWGPHVGAMPKSIRVKDLKSRWGSCTRLGNISLNWRLIMAPPEVFDYVVLHELCHLVHLNHSPAFWDAVRRVMPAYRERSNWLRDNGASLDW